MKKGPMIGLAILILIVLSAAIYLRTTSPRRPGNAQELDKVSVRMKWFFAGTMTGWFAGKEQGIFKTNGIDLRIVPGGPDNNAVKLVAAGTDAFGVAGADEVLMARAKGIPVVAIGVIFKESPICFISKKTKGITSPKDWSGKTIEVSYGSNAEVQYRALFAKYKPKNIKEVPYTFNLVPFIEDKVDVSVAYRMDQVVTLSRKGIQLSIITAKEHGINPYGDVVITTEKMYREKPDLVHRFMKAVVESQRWAIEHPDSAVANLVATARNLAFDNELAVWQATIPFILADGGSEAIAQMTPTRWQDTKDILVQFAGLAKDTPTDSAYVTTKE